MALLEFWTRRGFVPIFWVWVCQYFGHGGANIWGGVPIFGVSAREAVPLTPYSPRGTEVSGGLRYPREFYAAAVVPVIRRPREPTQVSQSPQSPQHSKPTSSPRYPSHPSRSPPAASGIPLIPTSRFNSLLKRSSPSAPVPQARRAVSGEADRHRHGSRSRHGKPRPGPRPQPPAHL